MCINKEKKIKDGDEPAEYLGYKSKKISSSFSTPFYKSGTIQNQWNKLYNDYCDRIRSYVSESSLRSADTRFVNWTRKDLDENSFIRTPDTLPT